MIVPVEGKAFRFGPGRDLEPAASIWKVWAEGSEVYASSRSPGGSPKVSVHASGQVHYRLDTKLKLDLSPVMQLGSGPWLHAFELRFLLSDGAILPFGERESLKKRAAYLMPVPDGFTLHANLIIGPTGATMDLPLPAEFQPAGQALWRTRLRDGRLVLLVGRMLETDSQNRDHIEYIRSDLKPTITFGQMPSGRKYVEVFHVHWSPGGGNVVLAIPMGAEAFRSDDEGLPSATHSLMERQFLFGREQVTANVIAPNGASVAQVELHAADLTLNLIEGTPWVVDVGSITLRLNPGNLIEGSTFVAAPIELISRPTIGGVSPPCWRNLLHGRFDGTLFHLEMRQGSIAFQNRNLASAVHGLEDTEELLMAFPSKVINVSASLANPIASIAVPARFTLRDRR